LTPSPRPCCRHQPQPAEHVLVDDVDDAGRGGIDAKPHRVGDGGHGGVGRVDVEGDLAAASVAGR
jgi:hypothetical protein